MAFSMPAREAPAGLEQTAELAAIIAGGQHEQLARDELITPLLRQLVGHVQAAC